MANWILEFNYINEKGLPGTATVFFARKPGKRKIDEATRGLTLTSRPIVRKA